MYALATLDILDTARTVEIPSTGSLVIVTPTSLPAIRALISAGVPVYVTEVTGAEAPVASAENHAAPSTSATGGDYRAYGTYSDADQANDALQTSANRADAIAILGSLSPSMLAAVADLNYVEETNRTRLTFALVSAVHGTA